MIAQYPDKNQPGSKIIFFVLALNIIGVLIACTKIESIAKINIGAFLVLQCDSVTVEANLIDLGTGISEYGHCWDIFPFPTTDDSKTIFHNATVGTFRSNLTGLIPGSKYYVRAYCVSKGRIIYSNETSFIAPYKTVLSRVTTETISNISYTTATGGGNITFNAGARDTRGVCWSTSPNPTIELSTKTINGTGLGSFTSEITGLSPNTTYHVRAYVTNSAGTAYGADVTFTTLAAVPPTLTTTVIAVTQNTALSGGNVTFDGGEAVTARGVCWSTSSNPTVALSTKTTNGSGTGSFTSNITGLSPNTTYHVRAYATNSAGTGYGTQLSFTTPDTITDADGNVYNTVIIGTQVWTAENLKTTKYNDGSNIPLVTDNTSWGNLTTPGYCWYNNDAANHKNVYGALYNWYAVNTGKLCPAGWHVPSDTEWTTLTDYLGGESVAGGKLKSTGTIEDGTGLWHRPNPGATNETGFTAVPGGYRYVDGTFCNIGSDGQWWSSTATFSTDALCRFMLCNNNSVSSSYYNKKKGNSVRCVRD